MPQLPPPMPPSLAQQALPFAEASAVQPEVLAEIRRLWIGRPWWRRRFASLEELLADPKRRHVLEKCARAIWINRVRRAQAAARRG